ncbi:MAG: hypothetical protein E7394_09010 [Ruminococcaceae bacterium]|nr:hypothetical protein [Oscillospiraceae bacterium]
MLPYMKSNVKFEEKIIKTFGGINVTDKIQSGELCAAKNMSSDEYPSLAARVGRKNVVQTDNLINGVGTCDGIVYTSVSGDNKHIYLNYDGIDYEFSEYSASVDYAASRKLAALSESILIIPDNVVFWLNSRTFTSICISQTHTKETALKKFADETSGNDLLSKTSVDYVATLTHNSIECRHVGYNQGGSQTFYYSAFDSSLKAGDVITVKGIVYSDRGYNTTGYNTYCKKIKNGIVCKIKNVETVTHSTPGGTVTESVALRFDDHSIDAGGFSDVCFRSISIERGVPNLKDICAFNNRIWGISGKQIYASKLSDPSEWNDFSVDEYGTMPYASFQTSSQTEGEFTGIISYGNNIYAFKENVIHKIMGNQPDEYTLQTTVARGVGKNMGDTLSVCGDSLFYCGSDGVYIYSGRYPKRVSDKLGIHPKGISGTSDGNLYYVLCEEENEKRIYVYDAKRKIWHCQDCDSQCSCLTSIGGDVYFAYEHGILLQKPGQSVGDGEKMVRWSFKIRFDERTVDKHGISKLMLRYSLGHGASFTVRALYDDKSHSAVCGARFDEIDSGGYTLSMAVKRSLWFELKFDGIGEFKLKSIGFKSYRGSER